MSENAPGQLLGFTIQFPRALCHLLNCTPGSIVCVEVHGDVATIHSDGSKTAEEDKSSVNSNPVTDKSSDLWKTFSNWINAVNSGELEVGKTKFILFRNKPGRSGIADAFHSADSAEQIQKAVNDAITKMSDINEEHVAWTYYDNAINANRQTLEKIIQNFTLETGSGDGFHEVEALLKKLHVPEKSIRDLATHLGGWILRNVVQKISQKEDARISWEDFNVAFLERFEQARRLELIDFTLETPLSDDQITFQIALRPMYLLQAELVGCDHEDLLGAVTDFLKAKTNRDRWIESELLDESSAAEFESKLHRFWKTTKSTIKITNKTLAPEDKGRLLYNECQIRQETIKNSELPDSTVAGTYHALANGSKLGWHEDWESRLKNGK
ncbi:ABC-three component system protein [Pseudomonas asiatica]|uniref:ABC-three component systems C-terminal domain-containing protein n=1 Tax=Pseudomonas asiatica TaxID=2219225 RepID=A0A9X4D520_9PSED|nr:ABC-three component system protein [Pseudomonas asiatica]MDD2108312.1 hypothetical protein [Pseudomonas asiatica]